MLPSANKRLSTMLGLSIWGQIATQAFLPPSSSVRDHASAFVASGSDFWLPPRPLPSHRESPTSTLFMTTAPADVDFDSSDPFVVLGLDPSKSRNIDKKEIKRAYKRLALRYHPDVTTNKDSSALDKKEASDRFSKINAAYEILSGKRQGATPAASSSKSPSSGGWTPPHRRKYEEYTTNTNGPYYGRGKGGTSWEDFMPKYDEADYDAGGDSFGAILSDFFAGAAGAAAGGGVGAAAGAAGVVKDFIDFLEGNIDGYSSGGGGKADDAELTMLLQTGTVNEIADEMDETDLVVQQLTTKLKNLQDELVIQKVDLAGATRYMEKLELEERIAEVEARKGVVENYLKKARKRLLALQTRYKVLIFGGANDSKVGRRSDYSNPSSGTSRSSNGPTSSTSGSARSSSYASRHRSSTAPEDSWKTEGFGSGGRSRGGSRRRASSSQTSRARQTEETNASADSSRYQEPSPQSRSSAGGESSSGYQRSSSPDAQSPPSSSERNVPPHRRTSAYSARDDTERLRQLKVDDEFEKLKKDLGLY